MKSGTGALRGGLTVSLLAFTIACTGDAESDAAAAGDEGDALAEPAGMIESGADTDEGPSPADPSGDAATGIGNPAGGLPPETAADTTPGEATTP